MTKLKALPIRYLCRKMDGVHLGFKNTNEIKILSNFIGQERALEALIFGIGMKGPNYNIYAMGPSGLGKRSLINTVLKAHAVKAPHPSDWCYLHNFVTPEKPVALALPQGFGAALQQDMQTAINEIGAHVLTLFESDEYRVSMKKISNFYDKKRKPSGNNKNNTV